MDSPVCHPRANAPAERAVQTVKRALQAWSPNLLLCQLENSCKRHRWHIATLQRRGAKLQMDFYWDARETTSNSRFRLERTHSFQGQWKTKGSSCYLHHQEGLEHIFHTARKLNTDYSSGRQANCEIREDNLTTESLIEETRSKSEPNLEQRWVTFASRWNFCSNINCTKNPNHQSLQKHQQETENNPTDLENLYPQTCLKRREDRMVSNKR